MKRQRGLLQLLLMISAITGYTGIEMIFESRVPESRICSLLTYASR